MKKIFSLILLVFTFSFLSSSAQQSHFIYFQTENKQPFYIKLDNKILTSSSSGYLILPRLNDGEYAIKFGSTKNEWPEQGINYKLNKDAGFVFKNLGDKGWGFFNLQSMDVIMANTDLPGTKATPEVKDDDFSTMLANVVNDSTIKEKDVVAKEKITDTPKENVVAPAEIPQASTAETETTKTESPKTEVPVLNSVIKRSLKKKNKDGMELIYIDEYNDKKDTIKIFIPVEKSNKNESKPAENVVPINNETDSNKTNNQQESTTLNTQTDTSQNQKLQVSLNVPSVMEQKKDTVESLLIITPEANEKDSSKPLKTDTLESKENKPAKEDKIDFLPATSGKINPGCKEYANEDDFLKLRKKMVSESNEDNMIKVAKKAFKLKCFSTEYVKNLSVLFLKDEAKYNFFDAAYSYVSDTGVFPTLENQLSDAYYINRFKAMIHP